MEMTGCMRAMRQPSATRTKAGAAVGAGSDRLMRAGAQTIELRRVKRMVLAGRAVLHRDREVRFGLGDVVQAQVRRRNPEMELVIVRVAVELLREEVPSRLVVAPLHRRHA